MGKPEPIFNAPRIVMLALGLLAVVHVGRELASEELDQSIVLAFAFIPGRYVGDALPGGEIAKVTSFLTHALLHADFMHLGVNCGWLLAFGSIVARRIDGFGFVVLAAVSAIAGAGLFLAFNWGLMQPMVGASGAISGLMGAANRFMFQPGAVDHDDRRSHARQLGTPPCMTLSELFQDRRSRLMIGSWLALNMLFGLLLGSMFSAGGIAWEAHMGGFIAGLLLFPVLDRRAVGGRSPDIVRYDADE